VFITKALPILTIDPPSAPTLPSYFSSGDRPKTSALPHSLQPGPARGRNGHKVTDPGRGRKRISRSVETDPFLFTYYRCCSRYTIRQKGGFESSGHRLQTARKTSTMSTRWVRRGNRAGRTDRHRGPDLHPAYHRPCDPPRRRSLARSLVQLGLDLCTSPYNVRSVSQEARRNGSDDLFND
jgi:hypothetical protein